MRAFACAIAVTLIALATSASCGAADSEGGYDSFLTTDAGHTHPSPSTGTVTVRYSDDKSGYTDLAKSSDVPGANRMGGMAYEPTTRLVFFAPFTSVGGKDCLGDAGYQAVNGRLMVADLAVDHFARSPVQVAQEKGEITAVSAVLHDKNHVAVAWVADQSPDPSRANVVLRYAIVPWPLPNGTKHDAPIPGIKVQPLNIAAPAGAQPNQWRPTSLRLTGSPESAKQDTWLALASPSLDDASLRLKLYKQPQSLGQRWQEGLVTIKTPLSAPPPLNFQPYGVCFDTSFRVSHASIDTCLFFTIRSSNFYPHSLGYACLKTEPGVIHYVDLDAHGAPFPLEVAASCDIRTSPVDDEPHELLLGSGSEGGPACGQNGGVYSTQYVPMPLLRGQVTNLTLTKLWSTGSNTHVSWADEAPGAGR